MAKRILIIAAAALFVCGLSGYAYSGTINLPQTGQSVCYDTDGTVISSCAGTGQDGDIKAGAAWPSPRFTVNGDCVTDNLTGLMWTKNANGSGGARIWFDALSYANNLELCGYSDWRLPNVNEIESLTHAGQSNQAAWLNTEGFINVASDRYWSSTTPASYRGQAWVIYMDDNKIDFADKNYGLYVWPVRGVSTNQAKIWKTAENPINYRAGDDGDLKTGAAWPSPRFTVSGDCITDNLTGLMWPKNANLDGAKNWFAALTYADNLSLCGYADWRLPNRKELRSLIDYSNQCGPSPSLTCSSLPSGHPFTSIHNWSYWTSSTAASGTDHAWSVNLEYGIVWSDYDKQADNYVLPVRSGSGYLSGYPNISANPTSKAFGNVTVGDSSPGSTFVITNNGSNLLYFYSVNLSGTDADQFFLYNSDCLIYGVILPAQNCTVGAVFSPMSSSTKNAYITITSNDPDTPILNLNLSGTGIGSAQQYTLTVSLAGAGHGAVTSSPSGIDCSTTYFVPDCSEDYAAGATVTLSASPTAGYVFSGWSGGGCSGIGSCVITMNANTTVTATFASGGGPPPLPLLPDNDETGGAFPPFPTNSSNNTDL